MESLAGQFLVASPSILAPNFQRAVVFITAHSEEGAVGVILNRRSEATVGDAVPQLAPVTDLGDPVFVGGPVNPEGGAVLADFHDPDEAGVVVIEDIGFVALDDALEDGAPEPERTPVFAGVAGWGPGQPDDELGRGARISSRTSSSATTGSSRQPTSTTSSPRIPKGCGAACCAAKAASTSS